MMLSNINGYIYI